MNDHVSLGWQRFIHLCQNANNAKELDALLTALFTPEEKQQLSLRIELVRELLKQEKSQRDIAKSLEISIATITRGSNMLKTIKTKLREAFERLI